VREICPLLTEEPKSINQLNTMTQITVNDNKKHIYALSDVLTSSEIVFVASKQPAEKTRFFDTKYFQQRGNLQCEAKASPKL
jgi:hypothetical protein